MANDSTVSGLLTDIEYHEYILPEFQRGYVWTPKQVKEYLTSLYRKYPTGSFLIWKTPQSQKSRGLSIENENKYYKLILDGQQRLTSLYALFKGAPPPFYEGEKLFFNIYFNIDTEEFTYYMEKKMKDSIEWIPVTKFFQTGGVGKFIAEAPDIAKSYYTDNIAKLVKLEDIKNYKYSLAEISELDIEEVVNVFNLVNSSGTPLSKADLALAHICSYWPDARDIFKQSQAKFNEVQFKFDLDFLTVCISAVAVDSVLFERSFYSASIETIQQAWKDVEKSLEYLINVFTNDAFIESSQQLKTVFALVPLVYHLSHNNFSFRSEEEKKKYLYWMLQALMWGRYSGRPYQTLQSDIVNLKNTKKIESLIDAIRRVRGGNLEVSPDDLSLEGTNSRFYPLAFITARSNGAVDWFNGLQVNGSNLGKDYKIHNHHIFPQSVLYKHGYKSSDRYHVRRVNELGNLAFITQESNYRISNKDPLLYLQEVKQNYPNALTSQFMPSEDYWELDRYEDFLSQRRKMIAQAINEYLAKLLENQNIEESLSTANIIALGENEITEFKSSFRWDYKLSQTGKHIEFSVLKTIAAFLNYNGGTLYIGVTDEGKVVGIEKDLDTLNKKGKDGFELYLSQAINTAIGKEFRKYIHISFESVIEGIICVVRVEVSKTPAYIRTNNAKEFYIRSGNASQSLDMEETVNYIRSHWDL